ncbi:MAG: hypothetical protein HY874_00040 [Chloroflexi bacterium]|nr:hypothetical protein [Chloroflexota bacterium]
MSRSHRFRTPASGPTCSSTRAGSRTPIELGLEGLVDDYLRDYAEAHGEELAWYRTMPLPEAVRVAALSCTSKGKRHPHQRRLALEALMAGARILAAIPVQRVGSFDDLHRLVAVVSRQVPGLGPVWSYDVAQRIGAKLGLEPERVYVHAGTAVGAVNLGLGDRETIEVKELPREIRRLRPWQVEDFLCIYAEQIAGLYDQ